MHRQDLCTRSVEKVSWQDLCAGPLGEISVQHLYTEGGLEAKLLTIWTDGKAEVRRVREEKNKDQKKQDAGTRKGRIWLVPICHSNGRRSQSRLPKAADAEPSGQMRDQQLHPVVARRTCPSQNVQSTSSTFGSGDIQKPKHMSK